MNIKFAQKAFFWLDIFLNVCDIKITFRELEKQKAIFDFRTHLERASDKK